MKRILKRLLKPINELIKKFPNVYQFCSEDTNKFVLLLKKGFYPYKYMDIWERFDETSLPDKKFFYSELHLEDITEKDYAHAQKVFDEFNSKDLGDYHDLYVQSNILLLADVFENFRNKCIEIYKLDPAPFLLAPGLAWQACLKETGIRFEVLIDIDICWRLKKEFEVEYVIQYIDMLKQIINIWRIMIKNI